MPRTIQVSEELYIVIDRDAKRHESDSDVLSRWARSLGLLAENVNQPASVPDLPQGRVTRNSPRRVEGFQLFGQHHTVDRWWKLFAKVAEILIVRHPDKQNLLLKSTHVDQQASSLREAKPILQTRFHFEATQSAASFMSETEALLRLFGYDPRRELTVQEHVARRTGNR